jgi:hypothetical protein
MTQLFDPDDTRLFVRDLIDPRDMDVSLGPWRRTQSELNGPT